MHFQASKAANKPIQSTVFRQFSAFGHKTIYVSELVSKSLSRGYFAKSKKFQVGFSLDECTMWPLPGAGMPIINSYCKILSVPFDLLNPDTVGWFVVSIVSKL